MRGGKLVTPIQQTNYYLPDEEMPSKHDADSLVAIQILIHLKIEETIDLQVYRVRSRVPWSIEEKF